MEILVFDKEYNNEDNSYLSILERNLSDYHITLTQELTQALDIYKNKEFHMLLIDFTSLEGKNFLNEVNRLNSSQKIVTMGYSLNCSSDNGCEFCIENLNKRRLIKPIDAVALYKTIHHFNEVLCNYAYKFEDTKLLIKDLVQRYNYFSYNENDSVIFGKGKDIHQLKQFLDLISELKKYNIAFSIIDDKSVKIL